MAQRGIEVRTVRRSLRAMDWLDKVNWTDNGLVPAIAQDARIGGAC